MNLDNKTCGMCDVGKLRGFKDEVACGVFVDAYKCDKCKEVAYTESVMRKVEAMQRNGAESKKGIK